MKNSMKVALSGMMAALSIVLLFLTGVVPVATIALPAIAGCLLIPIVAEAGVPWGFGTFAVCAVLSFILAPDREAALIYLLFFGYYPVAFGPLSRIKNKALQYVVKLLIFNVAAVSEGLLSIYWLGIPMETIGFLGAFTPVVLLALANIVFIVYDFALGGLIATYYQKLRPKIKGMLKR